MPVFPVFNGIDVDDVFQCRSHVVKPALEALRVLAQLRNHPRKIGPIGLELQAQSGGSAADRLLLSTTL